MPDNALVCPSSCPCTGLVNLAVHAVLSPGLCHKVVKALSICQAYYVVYIMFSGRL